jgi:hypothetical protein
MDENTMTSSYINYMAYVLGDLAEGVTITLNPKKRQHGDDGRRLVSASGYFYMQYYDDLECGGEHVASFGYELDTCYNAYTGNYTSPKVESGSIQFACIGKLLHISFLGILIYLQATQTEIHMFIIYTPTHIYVHTPSMYIYVYGNVHCT